MNAYPTPNNERRWVCFHPDGSRCTRNEPHADCDESDKEATKRCVRTFFASHVDAAPVPSPVPSRPDTAQLRAMADEITTTGSGFPGLDTLDALTLVLAADWIDDHRCPTPEGGENLTSAEFLAAVRNIEQRHKDGTP